jgi:RNA polymerase primary sigma factor
VTADEAVDDSPVPVAPFSGVESGEWSTLIARGRESGALHAEEVTHVLRHVELTGDVLAEVKITMASQGIVIDETVESLADDTPSALRREFDPDSPASEPPAVEDADERLLSRRRERRTKKASPRGEGGTSDTVRMYLREIGEVDLLTVEDERRLAQLIEEGQIAAETIDRIEEEGGVVEGIEGRMLIRAVNRGERAKSELTQANLRLVVSIAKRYSGRGMQLLDLVQEGNLGLMRAVDKFDYTKGFKFSTYATWWIRQAITRSIADQARTIRIPVHMIETINKIVRTSRQMLHEIGREPTPEELAEKLAMPLEKVRKVLKIAKEPISLETPIGDEEDSYLGDFIEDKNAILPIDAAIQSNLRETTTRVLASLTPREERVLRMRFGIGMNTDHTLEEVGQQFSVTRERIRQIEAKALRKLKHPSRSRKLRSFLDN